MPLIADCYLKKNSVYLHIILIKKINVKETTFATTSKVRI